MYSIKSVIYKFKTKIVFIDYYNWIHGTKLKYPSDPFNNSDPQHNTHNKLISFRDENRFSKIVSDKLGIDSENFAISRGSNDYSFEKLFNEIENNKKEIYVVVLTLSGVNVTVEYG